VKKRTQSLSLQERRWIEDIDAPDLLKQRLARLAARKAIAHLWVFVSPVCDVASHAARAFLMDWLGAPRTAKNHPDLLELKTSGKIALHSAASIGHMLEQLALTPHGSTGRAILIDAAERMLPPTANGLLKALEEPPSRTLIVLTTEAPHLLLPTILSRAQKVHLPASAETSPLPLAELLDLLLGPRPITYSSLLGACGAIQKALEKEQARLGKESGVKKTECEVSAATKQEMASELDGTLTLWSHTASKKVLEQVYLAVRSHSSADPSLLPQLLLQAMNGIDRGADLASMLLWFTSQIA
jgi:hypothetical protein